MPEWIEMAFLDVCEAYQPKTISAKDMKPDGCYPVFGANGQIGRYDKYNHENVEILLGCRGSCGVINLSSPKSWVTGNAMVVRPRRPDLDRSFLKYYLEAASRFSGIITGVAQPQITRKSLAQLRISYPAIEEQHRIVAILDEVFEGVSKAMANTEKNLVNSHALFSGQLERAFDANQEQTRLHTLATEVTDGDHSPPPKAPSGIPFVTISNIVKETGEIDFSDTFFVSPDYFRNLKENKKPRVGDILYTVTGATLGIPILIAKQNDFCFQRHIGLIRPKQDVDSRWLCYALASPHVFAQATAGSTGAAQKTVSLNVLRNIEVPRISLPSQRAIADRLDSLADQARLLTNNCRQRIELLAALKHSILAVAFSGGLDPLASSVLEKAAAE